MHNSTAMSDGSARLEHMFEAAAGYELTSDPTVAGTAAPRTATVAAATTAVGAVAAVRACLATVQRLDHDLGDPQRVEVLRALEELKAAAAAAQARVAADLDAAVRARDAAAGLPPAERGRGVAAQVALARRDSPHRGGQHLGLATALVREMPHTLAALDAGVLSEWRATLLVRETACLSRAHRGEVDRALAGDPATLDGLGDRALAGRARAVTAAGSSR